MDAKEVRIDWQDLGKPQTLPTGAVYRIIVKREPIPIVFVPGIMGTRLRGQGRRARKVWDPDDKGFMLWNYGMFWVTAQSKMEQLLGPSRVFEKNQVVVDEDDASHNKAFKKYEGAAKRGWGGVFWDSYKPILTGLQHHAWSDLVSSCFDLPVYAFGYDWRDSAEAAAMKLKERVAKIKTENPGCKKVILVTHSMGGLVARSACQGGLESDVLAMIHTVQPVTGSPAAYWRMKAGFERSGIMGHIQSWVLGANGREVTALLGHMPGGLQLLPNTAYTDNHGSPGWLTFSPQGDHPVRVPRTGNPYNEIYRDQTSPWRLILWKDYLAGKEEAEAGERDAAWADFIKRLQQAEDFHGVLAAYYHPKSWHYYGAGRLTADTITLEQSMTPYYEEDVFPGQRLRPQHVERGEFQFFDAWTVPKDERSLEPLRPVMTMSQPSGDGDSTVPTSSGSILANKGGPGIKLAGSGHDSCFKDTNLIADGNEKPQPRLDIGKIIEGACREKIAAERRW